MLEVFGASLPGNPFQIFKREFAPSGPGTKCSKKHCKDVLSGLSFQGYSCQEHLASVKLVFREAAEKTRNHLMSAEPRCQDSVLLQLSTIAKCVWSDNRRTANLVLATSLLGPVHLAAGGGKVRLLNPVAFELEFADAKKLHLAKDRESVHQFSDILLKHNNHSKKNFSKQDKLDIIDRKEALFVGRAPYLSLHSIFVDSVSSVALVLPGGANSDPTVIRSVLAHAWKPHFSSKPTNKSMAKTLLLIYSLQNKFDWLSCPMPCRASTRARLARARDSAPGSDGVCNSCWSAAEEHGEIALDNLTQEQLLGRKPHQTYNTSMIIFPPKRQPPTSSSL